MGVFELHLHEPNLTLNVGESASESPETSLDWGQTEGGDEKPPMTGKLGPVLVVLVVIVLAMLRNRRRE